MTVRAAPYPVHDLAGYLAGTWSLLRVIDDRRRGQGGSFLGFAAFQPAPGGLGYSEAGLLALAGHRGPASQRYRYDFAAAERARVRFSDGRPFHDLELTAGRCGVAYPCGRDHYSGDFCALGPNGWQVVWRIQGPHKDLRLANRYLRYRGAPQDADLSLFVPLAGSATRAATAGDTALERS